MFTQFKLSARDEGFETHNPRFVQYLFFRFYGWSISIKAICGKFDTGYLPLFIFWFVKEDMGTSRLLPQGVVDG